MQDTVERTLEIVRLQKEKKQAEKAAKIEAERSKKRWHVLGNDVDGERKEKGPLSANDVAFMMASLEKTVLDSFLVRNVCIERALGGHPVTIIFLVGLGGRHDGLEAS